MKRDGLIFAILLLVVIGSRAQTPKTEGLPPDAELKGQVADTYHAPIGNAYVLVHLSGGRADDVRVSVDSEGRYSAKLPAGHYDVFVAAHSFAPTCIKVRLIPGKTTTYNPSLKMSKVEASEIASANEPSARNRTGGSLNRNTSTVGCPIHRAILFHADMWVNERAASRGLRSMGAPCL